LERVWSSEPVSLIGFSVRPDRFKRGAIIGCEMMLAAADQDPIAARLLTNLRKRIAGTPYGKEWRK
jgi:hypothetical protein